MAKYFDFICEICECFFLISLCSSRSNVGEEQLMHPSISVFRPSCSFYGVGNLHDGDHCRATIEPETPLKKHVFSQEWEERSVLGHVIQQRPWMGTVR